MAHNIVYIVLEHHQYIEDVLGPYPSLELARTAAQQAAMNNYLGQTWDVHQLSPKGLADPDTPAELGSYYGQVNPRVLWEAYSEDKENTRGA